MDRSWCRSDKVLTCRVERSKYWCVMLCVLCSLLANIVQMCKYCNSCQGYQNIKEGQSLHFDTIKYNTWPMVLLEKLKPIFLKVKNLYIEEVVSFASIT